MSNDVEFLDLLSSLDENAVMIMAIDPDGPKYGRWEPIDYRSLTQNEVDLLFGEPAIHTRQMLLDGLKPDEYLLFKVVEDKSYNPVKTMGDLEWYIRAINLYAERGKSFVDLIAMITFDSLAKIGPYFCVRGETGKILVQAVKGEKITLRTRANA